MRVGFVHRRGPLGQSIRTEALMAELRESEAFDDIIGLDLTTGPDGAKGLPHVLQQAARVARKSAAPVGLFGNAVGDRLAIKRTRGWLRKAKPDIIVAETIPVGFVSVEARPTCPVVVDVHGLTYEQKIRESGLSNPIARYWERVQSIALSEADQIVVVSEDMGRYISARSNLPVTVVENGGHSQPFRAHYFKPLRFLFSGMFEYWEAPEMLLELADRLPAGSCTLIGAGTLLKNVLASGRHFEYLGVLPHSEAMMVSSEFQVGLVPSSSDITRVVASPIKLLDYMSVGLPAIVAEVGSWSRVVARTDSGWVVPPGGFCDLAERLTTLDEQTWSRKSENGIRLIRDELNWRRIVRDSLAPLLKRLS